jgi:hypothetical protein
LLVVREKVFVFPRAQLEIYYDKINVRLFPGSAFRAYTLPHGPNVTKKVAELLYKLLYSLLLEESKLKIILLCNLCYIRNLHWTILIFLIF